MCGSRPASTTYTHGMKTHKIAMKDVDTINKWTRGALARRRFTKLILTKSIGGLKYPAYNGQELVATEETLFTDKELFSMLDFERGGKTLAWNNYFKSIGKNKQYQGQWTKDKYKAVWEGLGTIKFADGSIYQGQTKNGLFNGKGRMTHSNGDIYQGEWKDGKANGFGVFVDTNGSMYKGEWLNDIYHGKGCETWNYNTIKYEGEFIEGQKTGKGRFEFDNNYYEGDFVDGQFHGIGKYYFADSGKTYEGEFQENNITGQGLMIWPDDSRYEGQFINGKMEGQGVKKWPNGNAFDGMWKNNLQHGSGSFTNGKTGKATPEEWRDGKKWTWAKGTGVKEEDKGNPLLHGKTGTQQKESGWVR